MDEYWNCPVCSTSWKGNRPSECGCGNQDLWPSTEPSGKFVMVMFEYFEEFDG